MNNIKIISIDFDDTIVYTKWPNIIGVRPGAKKYINKLYNDGYKILINTCRSGVQEDKAIAYLVDKKIMYHQINTNFQHLIDFYKIDCRKMSADMYIDDKNILGILPWWIMYWLIRLKIKIKHLENGEKV